MSYICVYTAVNCLQLMDMLGITEKLSHGIIRPPRTHYSDIQLGEILFSHEDRIYERLDFDVPSYNQVILKCSLYKEKCVIANRPTVIYLHANSSSRNSAKTYLKELIGTFDVVSFDFRGCGNSTGSYITLGYLEKEDVKAIIDYINKKFGKRVFMLWGRSMGAVTGILYAAKYRGICALVADSPFSDLEKVIHSMAQKILPLVPSFMVDAVIDNISQFTQQKIREEYNKKYKIKRLKPIDCVSRINVPIFFIGSKDDELVDCKQIIKLYEATTSYKQLQVLEGGHNESRPTHLKQTIRQFLIASLKMYKCTEPQRKKIFSYTANKSQIQQKMESGEMRKQMMDLSFCEQPQINQGLVYGNRKQRKNSNIVRAGIFRR